MTVVRDVLSVGEDVDLLNASIRGELAATSLEQTTLFVALEDEFKRTIPPDEVAHIATIKQIVEYVESALKDTAP